MDWPIVDAELLDLLPPVLKAVVRALGYQGARDWLDIHGGVNVNLPRHQTEALGLTTAELARLRQTLAPHLDDADRLWMPKADRLWRLARNHAICAMADEQSIREQAHQYRLSSRQITNIRREGSGGDEQMDLFGGGNGHR